MYVRQHGPPPLYYCMRVIIRGSDQSVVHRIILHIVHLLTDIVSVVNSPDQILLDMQITLKCAQSSM